MNLPAPRLRLSRPQTQTPCSTEDLAEINPVLPVPDRVVSSQPDGTEGSATTPQVASVELSTTSNVRQSTQSTAGNSPGTTAKSSPAQSQTTTSQRSIETAQTSVAPLPDSNEDLFPDFTTSLLPSNADGDDTGSVMHEEHSSRDVVPDVCNATGIRSWQKALPAFIRPVTSQRTYRYHDFLKSKGAFSIPPPTLYNAILARYIEYVYPQLPVVDLHDILNAVATGGRHGKISLLLFQSILLAGSAYVDSQYVFEAGYRSRLALREELAERVRLLYDFDCESDRLILVQALILMTSWQEKGDEVKHLRHWISVAHNIALLLGLNRDPSQLPLPARRKHLWKRVWWSLYLRDRTLALGLRQTPLITRAECDLPELDSGDFDVQKPSPAVCSFFQDCGLLHDLDQQARLGEACIAQLKLSHHLADILQARYTTFAPKMGCTKLIALVLIPKAPLVNADKVNACSRNLDQWFRGLPDYLKYRSRLSLCFDPGQGVLMLHCSILNLFYYALVCALHRPYPSPILRPLSATETCFQRKSIHAADASMSILSELQIHDLISFLPTQGITFMMQAAITFLGDSKAPRASLQSHSQQNLEECLQILQCLRDVHSYSFWATNLLTTAARKLHHRARATNASRTVIDRRDASADGCRAAPTAPDSIAPLSFGLSSGAEPPEATADYGMLGASEGDASAYNGYQEPLASYEHSEWVEYPEWIDPYVLYENPTALDIFPDLEWPG
jgi:hypothetical protein